MKIRVKSGAASSSVPMLPAVSVVAAPPLAAPVAPASAPAASPAALAPSAPAAVPQAEDGPELAIVKSPIVGTFYRASEPGAKPFAEVGSSVKKGDVLCIIEAMKLMNEIDSEYDGEVVNVYVENGQAVQYGERLFAIRLR
jgi:acetyl-CoA carboxylase biotin carboxyl carrier protein